MYNTLLNIGLTGFAPLIQIWAGICLLFFYESILEKSPLDKHIQRLGNLYDAFFNKYQGELGVEDRPEHDITDWKNFLPAIKNMATLSFFFSVFLLCYVGIEPAYSDWYHALPVMNCAIVLYLVACVVFLGSGLFHSYLTPLFYIGVLILYFHRHVDVNIFLEEYGIWNVSSLSETEVTIYSLFTCISGLIVILIRLTCDYLYIKYKSKAIQSLNVNFDMMWEVKMGRKSLCDLSNELQQKMTNKASKEFKERGEVHKESIRRFIDEEIAEEYSSFTKPWYKRICFKRCVDC